MRFFLRPVLIALLFASATTPSAQAANRCTQYLMKNAVIDLQVVEKNGEVSLRVFKNETLVGKILNGVANLFESPLKLNELANVIHRLEKRDLTKPYFQELSDAFYLNPRLHGESFEDLPKKGPLVLYANHPLSGADAFAILAVVEKVRPDVKVVAANFLESLPGFKERAFIVNVLNTPEAKAYNKTVLSGVNAHVKNGGALLIFPSGSVSAWEKENRVYAKDVAWKTGLIRFGEQSDETVYRPIFVGGEPSERYLKTRARSVGLSNIFVFPELADQIGATIDLTLGAGVARESLRGIEHEKQIEYLRAVLYELGTPYFEKHFTPGTRLYPDSREGVPPLLSPEEYAAKLEVEKLLRRDR